jgi:hypothetical protein
LCARFFNLLRYWFVYSQSPTLRATWLRKQRAPEDLIRFWLGHAKGSITDGYSKLSDDLEFRTEVAEKVGVGFAVPAYELVPVRPMRVSGLPSDCSHRVSIDLGISRSSL